MEPQVGAAASAIVATDFSLWSLFLRADIIVKSVIIILILCSVYSWAIIFEKYKHFKLINETSDQFEKNFLNSSSIKELFGKVSKTSPDPMTTVFRSGATFLVGNKSTSQLSEKLKRVMDVAIEKEIEKYESKLNFLATVGSVAPFIRLFGTV